MAGNAKALAAAAIAGVAVIAAVHWWTGRPATVHEPRAGCATVVVAASVEKSGLMAAAADRYNSSDRTVNGTCYGISVTPIASGIAESRLVEADWNTAWGSAPDAWSPAASTWLELLRHDRADRDRPDILTDDNPSVVTTPIVLAMPEPKARALGWPQAPIGWSDLLHLAEDPRGWTSRGHPEWGAFALGKTNPMVSTSGLSATIGAFVAATGTSSDLTLAAVNDPRVREFVAGVENSVEHYGDTALTFLKNLQHADDAGAALGYVSAVAVEEKSVVDYNAGNPTGDLNAEGQHGKPRIPLVAVYPREGTLNSDNPFAVLRASWSETGKQAGAADFAGYLREPATQQLFTDAGFRGYDGAPGKALRDNDFLADDPGTILSPPSAPVLAAVRSAWTKLRKPARVLLVLDVSGSMSDSVGGGRTRLELAQAAAVNGLGQLADTDQVGLWTFPGHDTVYWQDAPLEPLGPQRQSMKGHIQQLIPGGGTPLYAVTRAAVEAVRSGASDDTINAVVVMTDGKNEYPPDSDLDGLVRELHADSFEGGVRVFTIGYGEDADMKSVAKISEASRAAAYDATDPSTIDAVFTSVLSNF